MVFTIQAQASRYQYKYNGKELQDELGLNWYDYGARNYEAALGRFSTIDPDTEKYHNQSSYVYADNNPVRLMDINGKGTEDDFKLDKITGKITKNKDTNDKYDRLYATDENGQVQKNNYIQIDKAKASDETVISDLSWTDSNGNSMSLNNKDANAVYKTFLFAANNSDVEWEAGRTKSNTYFISTGHDSEHSPSASDMMMSDKDILAYVHSHPDIDRSFTPRNLKYLNMYGYNKGMYYEVASMGYVIQFETDWNQVMRQVNRYGHYINYRYVYIPESGRLWKVGYHNPFYIRNIKNNFRRLFFGTLKK